MSDCIFCKIVKGDIPCNKVYEDADVLAFDDIHPMAPVHVVVVPKNHISTLMEVDTEKTDIMNKLIAAAQKVAKIKKLTLVAFVLRSIAMPKAVRLCFICTCTFLEAENCRILWDKKRGECHGYQYQVK